MNMPLRHLEKRLVPLGFDYHFISDLTQNGSNSISRISLSINLKGDIIGPSRDYLAIPLDIINSQIKRLLYVPATETSREALLESDNPLNALLQIIRVNRMSVIVAEWPNDELGAPTIYYEVDYQSLLNAYSTSE